VRQRLSRVAQSSAYLAGLIVLGGAEFRLLLLIGIFRFAALQGVILNKAMSLVVMASALQFRAGVVPLAAVAAHWPIIANLIAGSLIGAPLGAGLAARVESQTLDRVIAGLLIAIATVLVLGHGSTASTALLAGIARAATGVIADADANPRGHQARGKFVFAVSLPAMIVGSSHRRDRSFPVLGQNHSFALAMAARSIVGSFTGGRLLGLVPSPVLLAIILVLLAVNSLAA
jgi:uncharacterized protein